MDVKLLISKSGIPYIEFDQTNSIIFSKLTATDKGYKYLVFKADSFEKMKSKGKTVVTQVRTNDQFTVSMDMTGIPTLITKTNPHFNKDNMKVLKTVIKKYTVGDVIPFANIPLIEQELNESI
jgi:hypothetical protein